MIYYIHIVGGCMMNKTGFTLVELLAVIVVLTLIGLISTPIILNVIANSRESAFAAGVSGMRDAIKDDYSNRDFDTNGNYVYENGVLYWEKDGKKESVAFAGSLDQNAVGVGYVDGLGNVRVAVYTSNYCGVIGTAGSSRVDVQPAKNIAKQACLDKAK